ncbi:MAG: hypothetical protein AB1633_06130, partial [Elusimicrobiota bacterium]
KYIKGRVRFFGHEKRGAIIISKIMERLRFNRKERRLARILIANHMRPGTLNQSGQMPTPRAIYRFFRDMREQAVDILILALADRLSYIRIARKLREIKDFTKFTRKMLKEYFAHKEKISKPKLVDGYKIMEHLKIGPGKPVGELLKIIEQAQHLGKIKTTEEALKLARKRLPSVLKRFS